MIEGVGTDECVGRMNFGLQQMLMGIDSTESKIV